MINRALSLPALRCWLVLFRKYWFTGWIGVFLAAGLTACNLPNQTDLPTPVPPEELPTVIAATMAAYQTELPNLLANGTAAIEPEGGHSESGKTLEPTATLKLELPELTDDPTPTPEAGEEATPTPPATGFPVSSATCGSAVTSVTAGTPGAGTTPGSEGNPGSEIAASLEIKPTPTAFPEIPIAGIQIFKPGDLSKVASPIEVSAYLRPGAGGQVTIELFGEDGRLLARQIRVYDVTPGARVNLHESVPFQISAAAEVGRLVLSMADEAGRTIAVNSIDLILLSMGDSDINPSDAFLDFIYIQQPKLKTLVQGGSILVSGLARPFIDQSLVVHLIAEDGRVVGQRLVAVGDRAANGYGEFAVEVSYQVSKLTPVRLTIYEVGSPISPYRYLSSLELVLGP